MAIDWRDRISGYADMPVDKLENHPLNMRHHPRSQLDTLRDMIEAFGYVDPIKVQDSTNLILDGHARLQLAKENGETTVACILLDLNDEESLLMLAMFNPVSNLAQIRRTQTVLALEKIGKSKSANIKNLLENVRKSAGLDDAPEKVLPGSDASPFETLRLTLAEQQARTVRTAIERAIHSGMKPSGGNKNKNGNAIAHICEWYLQS